MSLSTHPKTKNESKDGCNQIRILHVLKIAVSKTSSSFNLMNCPIRFWNLLTVCDVFQKTSFIQQKKKLSSEALVRLIWTTAALAHFDRIVGGVNRATLLKHGSFS